MKNLILDRNVKSYPYADAFTTVCMYMFFFKYGDNWLLRKEKVYQEEFTKSNLFKVGFTLVKFALFHQGHQLFIKTGIKEVEFCNPINFYSPTPLLLSPNNFR